MIVFLEEHDLFAMSKCSAKLDEVGVVMDGIRVKRDALTEREKELKELIRYGEMYACTKPIPACGR